MSQQYSKETTLETIYFPSGHSISQVKRNAKRLSEELNIPLNKALDLSARKALGIPESKFHWAQAISILKQCQERFREECVNIEDETALFKIDPVKSFNDLTVVALDVKQASEFKNTGPWKQNRQISLLMGPAAIAWLAHAVAEEEDHNPPTDEDIDAAFEICWDYFFYFYDSAAPLKTVEDAINDISDRNFFQPEAVWMDGTLFEV